MAWSRGRATGCASAAGSGRRSPAAGVVGRALEADVHVVVVVGLVADDALARAVAVRVLEDPIEPALADAVVERPVVEDALDVEVEEDHLDAAVVAGGGQEALEQLEGRGAVEVVLVGVDEARRVAGRLLAVEQADVDVAAGLVRAVLGDRAARRRGDVADRQDVLVGERVEGLADRALGEIDRGLGAVRALGAADEVALAGGQRGGVLQPAGPRRAEALAAPDLAELEALVLAQGVQPRRALLGLVIVARARPAAGPGVLGVLAALAVLAVPGGLRAGVRGGGEGEEAEGDEAGERAHRAVMVKQAPGGAPVSFS